MVRWVVVSILHSDLLSQSLKDPLLLIQIIFLHGFDVCISVVRLN